MPFSCTKPIPGVVSIISERPWEIAQAPFQVAPRTWYVSGQQWVGAYLIETSEGCLLIDTGVVESLHLLVDSIYQLGHKPSDIKIILLSHAHVDHCGGAAALQALCDAELWMSHEDHAFMRACPSETIDLDPHLRAQTFTPDRFYADDEPVTLGDVSVRTLLTPGHTAGCTSFFWDVENPASGETYTVAMHGGVGANTMNDEYYATSGFLTPALRRRFLDDVERVGSVHVDIALPSHPNQISILDRAGRYTDESQPFLDSTIWHDFLVERSRQVREYDEAAQAAMMR